MTNTPQKDKTQSSVKISEAAHSRQPECRKRQRHTAGSDYTIVALGGISPNTECVEMPE
jgi:hypothetical protein